MDLQALRTLLSVPTHHAPQQCGQAGTWSPAVSDGSPDVSGGGRILKLHLYTYVCCVCVYMHGHLCAVADMQRSEDSLLGSVFSFHQVDPRD